MGLINSLHSATQRTGWVGALSSAPQVSDVERMGGAGPRNQEEPEGRENNPSMSAGSWVQNASIILHCVKKKKKKMK